MALKNCDAIYVQNACKFYGANAVLNDLTMRVSSGTIYGLLGPSGCGKTTLLNCLVGCATLDSGKVHVFGKSGTVIADTIGFMPQEVALASRFTIRESVYYFGLLFGTSKEDLECRFVKLSRLLDLPSSKKLIRCCSGGEQRRVSFAAALINNPRILILDEPTVGLDPILREILWNYFLELVQLQNTAIIITTHYIEEALKAHKVGFMRQGKLLTEESPQKLLSNYGVSNLEAVFLFLSQKHQNDIRKTHCKTSIRVCDKHTPELFNFMHSQSGNLFLTSTSSKIIHEFRLDKNRLKALFYKNFVQFSRNTGGLFATFLLPLIALFILLVAIGDDVRDLDVAIVDEENFRDYCVKHNFTASFRDNCRINNLVCKLLVDLDDPMIRKVFLPDIQGALDTLQGGQVWGVIHVPRNFSELFQRRIETDFTNHEDILSQSQLVVWIDVSNKLIGNSLKLKLSDIMINLEKEVLQLCNMSSRNSESIVQIKSVLYGNLEDKFSSFILPGMLLTVTFFMSVTNTVDTIITDRLEGTWNRSAATGVSSMEIILTHFCTQFAIVNVQIIELIVLTFFIYEIEYVGSLFEIIIILITGSICGMCYGFWISVVCKNFSIANFLTTGSFYPMVLLSGVLWPLEGMPKLLQYCALSLPITLPTISIRNIMKKGWNLSNFQVLNGLGVQIIWIVLLAMVCLFKLKQ